MSAAPVEVPAPVPVPVPGSSPALSRVADILTLGKPRITMMAVLTCAGAYLLAPGAADKLGLLWTLCGTALLVASANTLNMWLERDGDRLMSRTRQRPLPAGRMSPQLALTVGILEAVAGAPLLTFLVNGWAGLLGVFALVSYVLVYTPLKRRSPYALHVGAIPGAIPPLLGWAAATGRIDAAGLSLFGILLFWQIPHFVAIALFRKDEYANAGICVLPIAHGDASARWSAFRNASALLVVSVLPFVLGIAGPLVLASALALGVPFLGLVGFGLVWPSPGDRWARLVFLASLIYLTLLFGAFVVSAAIA